MSSAYADTLFEVFPISAIFLDELLRIHLRRSLISLRKHPFLLALRREEKRTVFAG